MLIAVYVLPPNIQALQLLNSEKKLDFKSIYQTDLCGEIFSPF